MPLELLEQSFLRYIFCYAAFAAPGCANHGPFPIVMHQFMSFITLCRFCIIHSGAARTAHCDLKQSWLDGKPAGSRAFLEQQQQNVWRVQDPLEWAAPHAV